MSSELNPKHAKFVQEYVGCLNATDAYMAIYPKASYESARRNSSRLLTNADISEEISQLVDRYANSSAGELVARLGLIARADITDLINADLGIDIGSLRRHSGAIQSIDVTEDVISTGDDSLVTRRRIKLKMYSKLDAIDKLARIYGMYRDSVKVELPDIDFEAMTDEQLDKYIEEHES